VARIKIDVGNLPVKELKEKTEDHAWHLSVFRG